MSIVQLVERVNNVRNILFTPISIIAFSFPVVSYLLIQCLTNITHINCLVGLENLLHYCNFFPPKSAVNVIGKEGIVYSCQVILIGFDSSVKFFQNHFDPLSTGDADWLMKGVKSAMYQRDIFGSIKFVNFAEWLFFKAPRAHEKISIPRDRKSVQEFGK